MAHDQNPFYTGAAGQRRAPLGSYQRKVEDLNLTSFSPAHRFRGGPRDPPALAFQDYRELRRAEDSNPTRSLPALRTFPHPLLTSIPQGGRVA
jgi:hypothetical protein